MASTSSSCHSGPKEKDMYEAVSAVALTAAESARAALSKAVKQEREVEYLTKEVGFLQRETSVFNAQQAETVKHVERMSCQAVALLNGWNDPTSALQLQVYLDGHAQKLALELDEESRSRYSGSDMS